jgi:hypothetical protein
MAWRGKSAGEYGVNLQYGVANPPPAGNLGQSYVTGMPVADIIMRPLVGPVVPGANSGVPGRPVQRVSGNPDVATGENYKPKSPYGGGRFGPTIPVDGEDEDYAAIPQFGNPRILGVGQESSWRGGSQFANDKLIARDRHELRKVGYERSGRDSGLTDPPKDGPARPSYQQVNRTINYQQGTDNDAAQDDMTRPYARNAQGMYMGTQGDGWSKVNGGTPGLWQPYGSYAGYTAGPVQGIQSPVEQGAPGDGQQSFFAGPPHGLHSPTLPDYSPILGYYMAVPQQRLPRIDRPSNSPIAGQSYSQFVSPQGQTGTVAQQSSGQNLTSAGGLVNWMQVNRAGWRGAAGGANAQ